MSELPLQASSKERINSLRDQDTPGDTPRSQGQIITQNPDLLNLLKEDSHPSLTDTKQPHLTDTELSSTNTESQLTYRISSLTDRQRGKTEDGNNSNRIKSQGPDVSEEESFNKDTSALDLDINKETAVAQHSFDKDSLESDDDTVTDFVSSKDKLDLTSRNDTERETTPVDADIKENQNNNRNTEQISSTSSSREGQTTSERPAASTAARRRSTSHIQSFINPDILRASGLDPLDNKYFFPKYVSLKSSLQEFESDNSKKKETDSESPEQTDRSENRQVEPETTASDPFTSKPDYPSFEREKTNSSSTTSARDNSGPDPDKTEVKTESGKAFLLVPVKVESPKRVSISSIKADKDLSGEDIMVSNKPRRIYIEAPEPDEDDDIRFVSSRIDDYDDKADTYRQLDEAVIADTSSHPSRSGKHVRYEDSDRYEDRSRSVAAPVPVRGIPLPTGPNADPVDELDLSREEEYQNSLKERVRETERHVSEMEVPKLPLPTENNEDFSRDSVDSYRQNHNGMARDSLDLYDGLSARDRERIQAAEKNAWSNPPQEPFSDQQPPYNYREYGQDNMYTQEPGLLYPATVPPGYYGDSWQQTAYVQRGDAIERYDVVIEQQFIAPQMNAAGNYDHLYINPDEAQDEQSYTQERFGVDNPESQTESTHSPRHGDSGYQKSEMQDSKKQQPAVPEKPQYDYVANNKYDYGKQPRRTYRQILDIKCEEKVKLETVFIKPKPKKHRTSKLPVLNRQQDEETSKDPELRNSPSHKAASAENLWYNRSAFLAEHKNGNAGQKKKLVKYPSESGLSTRRPEGKFTSAPPHERMMAISAPLSPSRQPLHLNPITQEIVTDEGQKIVVDVKLRLSSSNGQPGDYVQFGQNPQNSSPYAAGVPYGYPAAVDDRGHPAVQQYMPRQIGNQQYNSYIGYSPTPHGDMARHGEFKENRDVMSPYNKIPPIPKSSENPRTHFEMNLDDAAWQETESDTEGYAAQFKRSKLKAKEKPWYTVYKINDYRRMQKEVRLGTLGPDLDNATYRERMEKKVRQEEYARQVKLKNQKNLANRKPPSFPRAQETNDIMNKRKVAVEYAKKVPKPAPKPRVTKYNSYELASHPSPSPKGHPVSDTVEVIDLDKLQQRHERDKQNVAVIRQNMGSDRAVSQNA